MGWILSISWKAQGSWGHRSSNKAKGIYCWVVLQTWKWFGRSVEYSQFTYGNMLFFRLQQAHHNHMPTHNMVTRIKIKVPFMEHHNQPLDMQDMPDILLMELSPGLLNKKETYHVEKKKENEKPIFSSLSFFRHPTTTTFPFLVSSKTCVVGQIFKCYWASVLLGTQWYRRSGLWQWVY